MGLNRGPFTFVGLRDIHSREEAPFSLYERITIVMFVSLMWVGLPFVGGPRLRVNLASAPLVEVSPGDVFEIVIEVMNEGGSSLMDLMVCLEMPEGFTESVTGTNTRTIGPAYLSPHDGFGQKFNVAISKDMPLGSYALRITVTADNVSPEILSPNVRIIKK